MPVVEWIVWQMRSFQISEFCPDRVVWTVWIYIHFEFSHIFTWIHEKAKKLACIHVLIAISRRTFLHSIRLYYGFLFNNLLILATCLWSLHISHSSASITETITLSRTYVDGNLKPHSKTKENWFYFRSAVKTDEGF